MGTIAVLAGPNGGGKSSVGGRQFTSAGTSYFNPDTVARQLADERHSNDMAQINSEVWYLMTDLLREAIAQDRNLSFETTLGGNTITGLLADAASAGHRVRIWYVALRDADLHVERVERRVGSGGHNIPEQQIRARYDSSRTHLQQLIPVVDEIRVFDNSETADPATGNYPVALEIFHLRGGSLISQCPDQQVPNWARELLAAARDTDARNSNRPQ